MIFENLTPNFLYFELNKIFPKNFTIIDVGCGSNSILKLFKKNITYSYGVEIHKQSIEKSKKNKIHSKYICDNVLNIKKYFKKKSIDVVFSIDLIEHLKKSEAINLIKDMEKIAKKMIIIKTTNGYVYQNTYENNVYQKHLSGFSPNYFNKKGYKVLGIDGPYFLRVDKNNKLKQKNIFTSVLANLLDPIYRHMPKYSLNFLAYKYVN